MQVTPKPLSKDDFAMIDRIINAPAIHNGTQFTLAELSGFAELARSIILAEIFWREAVKNSREGYEGENGASFCFFCGGYEANQEFNHKPTCPWVLSQ